MTLLEIVPEQLATLTREVAAHRAEFLQFRDEVKKEFSAVRSGLRDEIRAGDEETRRYMRILYEDLKDAIRTLGEGRG